MSKVSNLNEIKLRLRAIRTKILNSYEIDVTGIVGSFARNSQNDNSDVDIIFTVVGSPTLFELAGATFDLETELGRQIDLVDVENMTDNRRNYIMRDFVAL